MESRWRGARTPAVTPVPPRAPLPHANCHAPSHPQGYALLLSSPPPRASPCSTEEGGEGRSSAAELEAFWGWLEGLQEGLAPRGAGATAGAGKPPAAKAAAAKQAARAATAPAVTVTGASVSEGARLAWARLPELCAAVEVRRW